VAIVIYIKKNLALSMQGFFILYLSV